MNGASRLGQLLEEDLSKVNRIIVDAANNSGEDVVDQVIEHISNAGGKRIRPMLALACAKIFGYDGNHHILLAAAVEFIHTATLLHDDVVDESLTRRGVRTANDIWGNKISVLVGDYLFSQAFKMMVETGSIVALHALASASSFISKSEVRQLRLIGKVGITNEDYLKLIQEKTAMLFAAACQVGAIAAGASDQQVQSIYSYGLNFGMTFQIMDDYLDYFGTDSSMGKKVGGDFYESKITAPVLLLLQQVDAKEKEYLEHIFSEDSKKTNDDLIRVTELMHKYDITLKVKEFALFYSKISANHLEDFTNNEIGSSLQILLEESVSRVK